MTVETPISPFLSKCYDMVDDPATDPIISWSSSGTSLVIHDVIKFEQELLPKYYKHRNFSSFIRQLNVYGFKKNDPAHWEFTNEGFIKGQKHMLRYIRRKKSPQGNCHHDQSQGNNISVINSSHDCQLRPSQEDNAYTRRKSSQRNSERNQSWGNNAITGRKSSVDNTQQIESQGSNTSTGACVEVGEFRLWKDIENLKKDKNVVMQELAQLRHHQQGADGKLHRLGERLQGMEVSQQQLMSFLAMVLKNPELLLHANETSWHISEISKKRPYLALEQHTEQNEPVPSDGQIVRYQSPRSETAKPTIIPSFSSDEHQQFDYSVNELGDFFENIELMPYGEDMATPMEDNGHYGNEGQIVIPYSTEDDLMDELLLTSPPPEGNETTESDSPGTVENSMGLEFTSYNTCGEPSQGLTA